MKGQASISTGIKKKSIAYLTLYVLACLSYIYFMGDEAQKRYSFQEISTPSQVDYLSATTLLSKALEENPNNAQLHENIGRLKIRNEASKNLEIYLANRCEKEIDNPEAHYNYALFLFQQGRYEAAEKCLIKALALTTNFGNPEGLLLQVYHRSEKWERLRELAMELSQSDTRNVVVKNYLEIAKKRTTYLQLLEKELENEPSAENHLAFSIELSSQKHYAEAFHHALAAAQKEKSIPGAKLQLGIAYFKLGDTHQAIKTIKEVTFPNLDSDHLAFSPVNMPSEVVLR